MESTSAKKGRFRPSTHTIPTPGQEFKRAPRHEDRMLKPWVVLSEAALMVTLAVALEVGLFFSQRSQGFAVPEENKLRFVSTTFLLSFVPTLFIIPIVMLWNVTDWTLRWYQPYVSLSQGFVPAEEALLLNYLTMDKISILWRSYKFKHFLIFISGATTLLALLLQPLAGSIFQIKPTPSLRELQGVTSTRKIDLDPNVDDLNAFLAAAGFTEAAVFHGLPDPPFVKDGWAIAEFTFPPTNIIDGKLLVETSGIQTTVNCGAAASSVVDQISTTSFSILGTSFDKGCQRQITFDPRIADFQFGVQFVPDCNSQTVSTFQPAFFWFFQRNENGEAEARSVFCQPQLGLFNIEAAVSLADGSLQNVTILDDLSEVNNITTGTLSGRVYNGVIFDTVAAFPNRPTVTLEFILARAQAIKSGIPGAIFRLGTAGGLEEQRKTFRNATGFLDLTSRVYRQHLAIAAKSIYFTTESRPANAKIQSDLPRLILTTIPSHILAAFLFIIGMAGLYVHIRHRQARKNLYLTTAPGTIASVVALTARAGFGELVLPYDDVRTLRRKLRGLTFGMDSRTGAIIAHDDHGGDLTDRKGAASGRMESDTALLSGSKDEERRFEDDSFEAERPAHVTSPSAATLVQPPLQTPGYPPPGRAGYPDLQWEPFELKGGRVDRS